MRDLSPREEWWLIKALPTVVGFLFASLMGLWLFSCNIPSTPEIEAKIGDAALGLQSNVGDAAAEAKAYCEKRAEEVKAYCQSLYGQGLMQIVDIAQILGCTVPDRGPGQIDAGILDLDCRRSVLCPDPPDAGTPLP